jgi:spermidine synthase
MVTFCEDAPAALRLRNLVEIIDIQSKVQRIRYFRSPDFGRLLVLDQELQHVEAWAPLYHETIVHLPCAFLRRVRRALLLGGGDLFAARELLKYPTLETLHLVDHDPEVVTATVQVYPEFQAIINDRRVAWIAAKAEKFLRTSSGDYDLIINDAMDLAQVEADSGEDLFSRIAQLMAVNGVCSDLLYRSIFDSRRFARGLRAARRQQNCTLSAVCVPEYPGFMHVLTLWGKNQLLNQGLRRSQNQDLIYLHETNKLDYFDPTYLGFYLYVPRFIRRHLDEVS